MPGRLWRQCYASDRYPDGSDQTELRKELRHFSPTAISWMTGTARGLEHGTQIGPIGRIDRGRYGVDGPSSAALSEVKSSVASLRSEASTSRVPAPPRLQFSDPLGIDIKTVHRTAGPRERRGHGQLDTV